MLEKIVEIATEGPNPSYNMKIPDSLLGRFNANELEVVGAMVKSKETGKIVGHLQQTAFNGDFNLLQSMSPFFGAANLVSSLANIGISVGILYKVTKLENTIKTLEQKIDFMIEDKFRSEMTKLEEIYQDFPNLMELKDPKGQAENYRTVLVLIKGEITHKLKNIIFENKHNISVFINLLNSISLCHKLILLTYFLTSELTAADKYGRGELEVMKNLFIDYQKKENIFGESVMWGVLGDEIKELYKYNNYWIPFHTKRDSIYERKDVELLNSGFRNYFQELTSQISIANSLQSFDISGRDFILEAGKITEEPLMFLPAPH